MNMQEQSGDRPGYLVITRARHMGRVLVSRNIPSTQTCLKLAAFTVGWWTIGPVGTLVVVALTCT